MDEELKRQLNALSEEEKESLNKLAIAALNGNAVPYRELLASDYDEEPVDILTFIDDDEYLGRALKSADGRHKVFPYWRRILQEIYESDARFEIILTGPIGNGKSTAATIYVLFQLHELLCLRDAYDYYNLIKAQPIALLFFSLTEKLSESGAYGGFQTLMQESPWFMNKGTLKGIRKKELIFPEKHIEFVLGSPYVKGAGIVGKNLFGGMLDEISETLSKADAQAELKAKKAFKIYTDALMRMTSRFSEDGSTVPGKLFLPSSRQSYETFLDMYIEKVRGKDHVLVYEDAIWNILPPWRRRYSGETFPVAVGKDKYHEPHVLTDKEDPKWYYDHGYDIVPFPIEHKDALELDLVGALRTIGGITTVAHKRSKLFPRPVMLEACVDNDMIPRFPHPVYLPFKSEEGLEDFFKKPDIITPYPRYIHVDIGISGDRLGIAMAHASDIILVERITPEGTVTTLKDSFITVDFMARVSYLPGEEIPIWKITAFIMWLRKVAGYPIRLITFDGYQSKTEVQRLVKEGLPAETMSVDRDDEAYLALRSSIYEERIAYCRYPIMLKEMSELEHLPGVKGKRKVDHPDGGSKDVADALAGAVFNATKETEIEAPAFKTLDTMKEYQKTVRQTKTSKKPYWFIQ